MKVSKNIFFVVFVIAAFFCSCVSSDSSGDYDFGFYDDDGMNTYYMSDTPDMALAAVTENNEESRKSMAIAENLVLSEEKSADGFFVSSFAPLGVIPSAVNFPSIQIQFSEPVVALAKLGEPMTTSDVVEIYPPIKGVFRWYGTGLLSFDCEDALIPQKFYTAKINESLTSINGTKISGQTEFVFHTEEIRLTGIEAGYTARTEKKLYFSQNDIPPEYATDIAVSFSNNVKADVISKYISIGEKRNGKIVKEYAFAASQLADADSEVVVAVPKNTDSAKDTYSALGGDQSASAQTKRILLSLKDTLPKDADIVVTLKKGAMPDVDCYATTEDTSRSFHTLRPLEVSHVSGTSTLNISFNHRIAESSLEDIKKKIKINIIGQNKFSLDEENISIQYNSIVVKEIPVYYGSSYNFSLGANCVQDVYGQTYGKEISDTVEVPDADSFASFRNGNFQIMESQFLPRLAFEHQNILDASTYTVTPLAGVTEEFVPTGKTSVTLPATSSYDSDNKNRRIIESVDLSPYLEKTVGGQFRGALKFEGNIKATTQYWNGKKEKTEIVAEQFVQVTDLGITLRRSAKKIVVFVTSLSTGNPVQNATIKFLYPKGNDAIQTQADFYSVVLSGSNDDVRKIDCGKTDSEGLLVIDTSAIVPPSHNYCLEATTADDRVVVCTDNYYGWNYSKPARYVDAYEETVGGRAITFMYADSGVYRPGDKVSVKIVDRDLTEGSYTTYRGDYEIVFSNNGWKESRTVYKTETGTVSSNGAAEAEWILPEDLKPGNYLVTYNRKDGSSSSEVLYINVQFFERARFQTKAQIPEIIYFRGDAVSAEVTASYLGGGSLAGGSAIGNWNRDAVYFAPSGKQFENMTFGPHQNYGYYDYGEDVYEAENFYERQESVLSNDGQATFSVATGSEKKSGSAYKYFFEAQVTDAGNQMIAARTSTIVHPASFYIGLSAPENIKGFAKVGDELKFNATLATPDGKLPVASLLPNDKIIAYELSREVWLEESRTDDYGNIMHDWKRKKEIEMAGEIDISIFLQQNNLDAEGFPSLDFSVSPQNGGSYTLTLRGQDSQGRAVITQRSFYVAGSTLVRSPNMDATTIELSPDKEKYDVGDVAQILMSTTLEKGSYLLTLEREGIVSEKIVHFENPSSVIEIPIEEKYLPVVYVTVSSFSKRTGDPAADYDTPDANKPKAVAGSTALHISTKPRTFDIKIETDKSSYLPGSEANITLSATKKGVPMANAEITLMVVDRGVLDLTGYHVQNPLEYFYGEHNFSRGVYGNDSRNLLVDPVTFGTYSLSAREIALMKYANRMYEMAAPNVMSKATMDTAAAAYGFDEAIAEESAEESEEDGDAQTVRKDFRATAVFVTLVTDADGKVTTSFKLPDSLTEYRVTAVGIKDNNFALAEEKLIAANPVSVRDVQTRILRPDDEGEAGVVITNIGDMTESVTVKFDVLSGLEKTGYVPASGELVKQKGVAYPIGLSEQTVSVAAGETKTIMFGIKAKTEGWVTLCFSVKTSSNSLNEIIYKPLEIEKPYIYEAVTTVGEISGEDKIKNEYISIPLATDDGKGSLTVQLDATRLGTLASAIDYVFRYPYGCFEQRSSAVMPLISFGKYIDIFGLDSEVKNPVDVVQKEIQTWGQYQKNDGGFPYWRDNKSSSFAVSLRIAEILALAQEHGITIPENLSVKKLASYIASEVADIEKTVENNGWNFYPLAYSYYVLTKLGDKVSAEKIAKIVSASNAGISEYALAGLAALYQHDDELAKEASKQIKNRMALTARGASFQNGTKWYVWHYYNGNAERYALALSLLTQLDPSDVYVSHIVYELLEMQKTGNGKWQSTATTSRVLMSLETYITTHSLDDTDFTATVFFDGQKYMSGNFVGVNAKPVTKTEDFGGDFLQGVDRDKNLLMIFDKEGKGTLFYTLSMKYALPANEQKARDEGLSLYTEITDTETGAQVTEDMLESGKIYKQRVFVSTPKERTFVAVRVPVPAGAEILNPAFDTTPTVYDQGKTNSASGKIWLPYRMSHQDVYDAEIQCFWDYMPQGMQEVSFTFRAVRNGKYTTPSATAECMYEPEIFGRTGGKVWEIK